MPPASRHPSEKACNETHDEALPQGSKPSAKMRSPARPRRPESVLEPISPADGTAVTGCATVPLRRNSPPASVAPPVRHHGALDPYVSPACAGTRRHMRRSERSCIDGIARLLHRFGRRFLRREATIAPAGSGCVSVRLVFFWNIPARAQGVRWAGGRASSFTALISGARQPSRSAYAAAQHYPSRAAIIRRFPARLRACADVLTRRALARRFVSMV